MKLFTNAQIRSIEKAVIAKGDVTTIELVERAASAIAWEIMSRWRPSRPIMVFAGPGNNGADALALSHMLADEGYSVEVLLFNVSEHGLSEACRHYRDELVGVPGVAFTEITNDFNPPIITEETIVVDGLFGSGLKEPLKGGFKSLVDYINSSKATIVSIDIPSGMFAEWNEMTLSRDVIHASLTLAIEFPRLAFFIADNAEYLGEWKVLDIKLAGNETRDEPSQFFLLEKGNVRRILRQRSEFCSKKDFGSMLLVAGSYGMMGAAQLAAIGALRSGVGRLTVHSPRCGFAPMQTAVPEAMFHADRHDIVISDITLKHEYSVVALGPGMGTLDATVRAVEAFINTASNPLVIDADALNCIAQRPNLLERVPPMSVITPHDSEFDRLFGPHTSQEMRLKTAIEKSAYYNIVILLKGHYTYVVRPDGKIYFIGNGTPALATPGSGDVLTGIIGSFMAQGSYPPDVAAAIGAFVHGYAGCMARDREGDYGVLASDVARFVSKAIREIMS
jgi:NAD(P)H-hydrate epimerase